MSNNKTNDNIRPLVYFLWNQKVNCYDESGDKPIRLKSKISIKAELLRKHSSNKKLSKLKTGKVIQKFRENMISDFKTEEWRFILSSNGQKLSVYFNGVASEIFKEYGIQCYFRKLKINNESVYVTSSDLLAILAYLILYFKGVLNDENKKLIRYLMQYYNFIIL